VLEPSDDMGSVSVLSPRRHDQLTTAQVLGGSELLPKHSHHRGDQAIRQTALRSGRSASTQGGDELVEVVSHGGEVLLLLLISEEGEEPYHLPGSPEKALDVVAVAIAVLRIRTSALLERDHPRS